MKKTFFSALLALSFGVPGFAATCEDFGATTETKQVILDIGRSVAIGEPQKFCVLAKDQMLSLILASTLLSKNPSLAATAYRTGPKPTDFTNMRADRTYCKSLGGTYQYGKGLNGGWVSLSDDGVPEGGSDGLCVFADGSIISTWTLFYKRMGNSRPDFTPHFQNSVIQYPLW